MSDDDEQDGSWGWIGGVEILNETLVIVNSNGGKKD